MSINSRCGRTDAAVRAGIAARLTEIQTRPKATTLVRRYVETGGEAYEVIVADRVLQAARDDLPALTNAVESVLDYVARCEESGITMQPGDVRRLIAAALGGAS